MINHQQHIPIQENTRPEDVKTKWLYSDGRTDTRRIDCFYIPVLSYDPEAYSLCEYYSLKAEDANGMDATGPFSWKFHRKLFDISSSDDMPPGVLRRVGCWKEVLIEPVKTESRSDSGGLIDTGVSVADSVEDVDIAQEKQTWVKQKCIDILSKC